jgi:hypothetical protein
LRCRSFFGKLFFRNHLLFRVSSSCARNVSCAQPAPADDRHRHKRCGNYFNKTELVVL